MRQFPAKSLIMMLVVLGIVMPADALTINPTYTNSAGQTWDATRIGVIDQAIDDWESSVLDPQAVNITFDFTNAGSGGYLGQWQGGISAYQGTDLYPWTSGVTHTIHFNADLFGETYYTWWDPTPTTADDQPFMAFDALSIARHELGHALGFTSGFYLDDFYGPAELDKWASHITGSTFDPGGLNVSMASPSNLAHVLDSGMTAGDLMVPALSNSQRRGISDIDLDMLGLAYGYQLVPEPSTLILLAIGVVGLFAFQRRRRS